MVRVCEFERRYGRVLRRSGNVGQHGLDRLKFRARALEGRGESWIFDRGTIEAAVVLPTARNFTFIGC